jgi:ABC-type cobalt transport system substrate-binding protein
MFKNMKKVWKYILSILLVLILATAGTIYYFLNVKTYETADEELEEIIESEYDIILPRKEVSKPVNEVSSNVGNEQTTSTDSNINQEVGTNTNNTDTDNMNSESATNNSDSSTNESSNPTKDNQGEDSGSDSIIEDPTEEVTVADIKDRYRPVFESLQSQANGKIDALTSRAFQEYQTQKSNGESISFSYFYQKYSSAGKELESVTDETFNYIYSALENELKENGYSPSHANDFREQYAAAKQQREKALLNKAKEAL